MNKISLCSYHLSIRSLQTELATGTGFICNYSQKKYLITAWHNISGKNPFTGEQLSNSTRIPNILFTNFHKRGHSKELIEKSIQLYDGDNFENPKWFVHPSHEKEKVDVIAIEIPPEIDDDYELYCIDDEIEEHDISAIISGIVFIIGYPFKESKFRSSPIWKKGSIASDPDIDWNDQPIVLIDTATRPGLSGSPVLYETFVFYPVGNGMSFDDYPTFGINRNLLGVYSGRYGKGEMDAQLGIVWKTQVIYEILKEKKRGTMDF